MIVHRVAALGTILISGLSVDCTLIFFSILLILPCLSVTVNFILCSHKVSKFTLIILLFHSIFSIVVVLL